MIHVAQIPVLNFLPNDQVVLVSGQTISNWTGMGDDCTDALKYKTSDPANDNIHVSYIFPSLDFVVLQ